MFQVGGPVPQVPVMQHHGTKGTWYIDMCYVTVETFTQHGLHVQ
jgi:hypothetical protein